MKELAILGSSVIVASLILSLFFAYGSVPTVSAVSDICIIFPDRGYCEENAPVDMCCVIGPGQCPGTRWVHYEDTEELCCQWCANNYNPDKIKDKYGNLCCTFYDD